MLEARFRLGNKNLNLIVLYRVQSGLGAGILQDRCLGRKRQSKVRVDDTLSE